ncbi:hypothetical protein C7K38_07585 [Tetragenococcus osmophilus]|uniref:Uncharacterized protein n=1 Tax=Tetragenococcus osmophilus TaxID=526944 RepID=A0AA38CYF8_9ENTE|nr:hypothetical protein [Tetragenococcus osmophilus]AYW48247.1 hypothetical protein C7K38_07585 [Tetragenococcus osmophilus]GMA54035.1 hypothetical protein GCM10025857_53920 [Alicyclobacillus contaminans]GMA72070.1 hypothetical protein GCM10025885_11190 [Tetragenococcus osmophilus]
MSFSKIALASLKYHRRMTTFYILFLVISFSLLFVIDSLKISLPYIYEHVEDLITSSGYSLERQNILTSIQKPTETVNSYYSLSKWIAIISFVALFLIYFFICQLVKEKEFLIWKHSGSTTFSWVRFNLLESFFPLVIFILIFTLLAMVFQRFFVGMILYQHLKVIESVSSTQAITEQLGQEHLDHLVVRFPRTNQALIQSILLPAQEWTKILFLSLGQTIRNFIFLIFPTQVAAISAHYYWRYKFWNKRLM